MCLALKTELVMCVMNGSSDELFKTIKCTVEWNLTGIRAV